MPHNYLPNCIVYPGTHDNDTAEGWYQNSSTEPERDFFRRYFRNDGHDVAWTLIEAAFRSVAAVAIVTLQDLLGLNSDARMNFPDARSGNWTWRYKSEQLSDSLANRLTEITELYGQKFIELDENDDSTGSYKIDVSDTRHDQLMRGYAILPKKKFLAFRYT